VSVKTAALSAEELLPPGPGLLTRWLVAVPLMLVAAVLPAFGQLALGAWTSLSFHDSLPDFGEPGPDPTFWSEFGHDFGNLGPVAIIPGIVLLVFLLRRNMFATWPKACLWLALWVLAPMTLFGWAIDDDKGAFLPNLALCVGLIWLTFELGRLTTWVLSRPVARDIARSELEIPYDVPGSRARLRIRRDRVRLDRLRGPKNSTHREILWPDLRRAVLDELAEPTSWQASPRMEIEVPAGPVLRVIGGREEWLLPVTEEMGEDLVAVITLRVHNKT
jgi:hypothetical protein